VQILNNNEN